MDNPLLDLARPDALPGALPDFDRIRPEHAEPALDAVLAESRERVAALLAAGGDAPGWDSLAAELEDIDDRIHHVWSPVSHLFNVCSTPEWRAAYNACLPKLMDYSLEMSQSRPLYEAWQALRDSAEYAELDTARRAVIDHTLRDFRLAGVALDEAPRARYREIALRLSELGTRFEEQLLDCSQAWGLHIDDVAQLAGMSEAAIAAARDKAASRGRTGWWLALDFPSYDAVISYADDRDLRETLYRAWSTRAATTGPHDARHDNGPLIEEILALRHEQAQLLGYAHYAELSLAAKMAESADAVDAFLVDLAHRARPGAEAELAELADYARAHGGPDTLEPWDLAYWSEKLREERLGLSDEILKPYFPLDAVLDGLFAVLRRLFGVEVERVEGIATWHEDVTVYRLREAGGDEIGLFYLDPYARDHKRGGAWMDDGRSRRRGRNGLQRPVAWLIGNFTPPLAGRPALLTHDEVTTLFHEVGHGLHHLLTRIDVAGVSGINGVAWDAVELPSQFMENFCFATEPVAAMTRHVDSGESLPQALLSQLQAGRSFQAALATLRQVEFALFDLRLHRDYDPARGAQVMATLEGVRDEVAALRPPSWNRFPNSFSHIFAGGYAAGYYSYKWAEVLSADAWGAFEEAGVLDPATGRRFRDIILGQGGAREAGELFREFRGREPSIEPLLRQSGLIAA